MSSNYRSLSDLYSEASDYCKRFGFPIPSQSLVGWRKLPSDTFPAIFWTVTDADSNDCIQATFWHGRFGPHLNFGPSITSKRS